MSNQTLLQQAVAAIKTGQKGEAKRLLGQLLEQEPGNVKAWLWLTEAVESDEERLDCLKKVLEIEPHHPGAQRGMQLLQAKLAAEHAQAAADEPDQPGVSPAIKALVTALQAEQAEARYAAVEQLMGLDDPHSVGALIFAMRDRNRHIRRAAVEALGRVAARTGDLRAVKPLASALHNPDGKLRLSAARALGDIAASTGDGNAVELLVSAMQDREDSVRQAAIDALARTGAPALGPLVSALQGVNRTLRQAAAETLVKIGPPAIDVLVPVLQHWDKAARQAAAGVLDELGWQPGRDELGVAYWIAKRDWDKCAEIGPPASEPLVAALQDLDNRVRLAAVKTLERSGQPQAIVEPLAAVLKDRDKNVRQAAAEALVRLGQPAIQALVTGLQQWNSHAIRRRVADVLDALGWQPDQGYAGASYWIARGEWDRCVEIGRPAIEPLLATLRDQDMGIRWAAADTLDRLGWKPDTAESGATYWIAKTNWYRCVEIGEPAVKPLIAVLRDSDTGVQQAAAKALVRIGTPEARAAVQEWESAHGRLL